MCWFSCGLR
jgi:hypothetical protein